MGNVLSPSLAFNLDYYTDVLDLNYLLDDMKQNDFLKKFTSLNEALINVIQDYSLVSFNTLDIQVGIYFFHVK